MTKQAPVSGRSGSGSGSGSGSVTGTVVQRQRQRQQGGQMSSRSSRSSGSASRGSGSSWHERVREEEAPAEVQALLGGSSSRHSHTTTVVVDTDFEPGDADGGSGSGSGTGSKPAPGKLPLSVKLAYGLPHLATAAMVIPTSIHINKFYADTLMLSPGTLAVATAVARAFDTVLDPLFGWLSDSTVTRWGRRKPYMAVGAPFGALFYFCLFNPPVGMTQTAAAVWFGLFFALYLIVPMSLPHNALGPELTQDYHERSSLYAWSEVFALVGVISAAAAPGLLSQAIPDQRTVFTVLSLIICALLITTFSVLLLTVKEPQQIVSETNPLVPGLRRAWRNWPFRILVITSVMGSVAHHCSSLMLPFFISYVLHPESDALWLSACLLTYFGGSAISVPLWCKLSHYWDKKTVWLLGWAVHLPSSFALFFVPQGSSTVLLMLTLCMGLSFGGSSYLYKAIQADAIDYDELRTTRRREGQYITFWALIPKLIAIPSASIPLVVLEASGYVSNQHPQTPEVVMTIRILATLFPCLMSGVALLVASFYPIDKATNQQIQRLILRRRRAILEGTPMPPQTDPVTRGTLPQITGGLTHLDSEFCWFLDYFSTDELWLVLHYGQQALITRIRMWIFCVISVMLMAALVLSTVHVITVTVMSVMTLSLGLALLLFHYARLKAAWHFSTERVRLFRKGAEEYFTVMANTKPNRPVPRQGPGPQLPGKRVLHA